MRGVAGIAVTNCGVGEVARKEPCATTGETHLGLKTPERSWPMGVTAKGVAVPDAFLRDGEAVRRCSVAGYPLGEAGDGLGTDTSWLGITQTLGETGA